MKRALSRNMSAQVYSQVVTLVVQLGSIPILISIWGLETFGVWVLLTALPNYLTFSDFGFTFVAKNDMSIHVSRGDRAAALITYQSIFMLLLSVLALLAIVFGVLILTVPLERVFILGPISKSMAQEILALLFAKVMLYQLILLLSAGVRCEGRPAREAAFTATLRLVEGLALVGIALSGASPAVAAAGMLLVYGVGLIVLWLLLHFSTPWLKLGFAHAQRSRLRSLLSPSLSYMLFPLGLALLIHAPIIILGTVAGPTTVTLYSVTRTVARIGTSASNVVNHAVVPEYSFAWGRGDISGFKSKMRVHALWTSIVAGLYALLSLWLIPLGVEILSGGEIITPTPLVLAFLAAVLAEILWTASFAPLSAINRHGLVARAFFCLTLVALTAAALLAEPVAMAICVAVAGGLTLIVALLQLQVLFRTMSAQSPENVA